MLNFEKTVQSEYANSPTLFQLIENMNTYIDPSVNIKAFYDYVWNVSTAIGFGLDIWGRIVGVGRVIPIPATLGVFGFANDDNPPDWQNWGSFDNPGTGGPFYGGQQSTGSFTLNDSAYRTLILTKALSNIVATNAPSLNTLVRGLFPGRGRAYTIDRGNMAMSYVFEFSVSQIERAILVSSDVLPHPAGVQVSVVIISSSGNFGFNEQGSAVKPFNYGTFYLP